MPKTEGKKIKWCDPVLVKMTSREKSVQGEENCSPSGSAATDFCILGASAEPPTQSDTL